MIPNHISPFFRKVVYQEGRGIAFAKEEVSTIQIDEVEVMLFSEDQSLFDPIAIELTSHYIYIKQAEHASALALSLIDDSTCRINERGWFRSDEVVFSLTNKPNMPQNVQFSIRVSPKSTLQSLLSKLQFALNAKAWQQSTVRTTSNKMRREIRGVGIAAVLARSKIKREEESALVESSLSDINSLMNYARPVIDLVKKIQNKTNPQASKLLLDLGLTNPVSTEASNYHQKLSDELIDFLIPLLESEGGIMVLTDAFCYYNRARGIDMVSPSDFRKGLDLIKDDAPILLRKLSCGEVLCLRNLDLENIKVRLCSVLNDGFSIQSAAQYMKCSPYLAELAIQKAEIEGRIARDESFSGIRYYYNRFLDI
ncbi:hypothetical protein PCE1_004546 [Barthelona sp. PCE]